MDSVCVCGLFRLVKDFTFRVCDCSSQIASVLFFVSVCNPPVLPCLQKLYPVSLTVIVTRYGFVVERMLVNLVGLGLFIDWCFRTRLLIAESAMLHIYQTKTEKMPGTGSCYWTGVLCAKLCCRFVCVWFSFDIKGTSPDSDHLCEVAVYLKKNSHHLVLMCVSHFKFELITILQCMHLYLFVFFILPGSISHTCRPAESAAGWATAGLGL